MQQILDLQAICSLFFCFIFYTRLLGKDGNHPICICSDTGGFTLCFNQAPQKQGGQRDAKVEANEGLL